MNRKNKRNSNANNRQASQRKMGNGNRARRARARTLGVGQGTSNNRSINHLAESLVNPWAASACVPDGAAGVGCFSVKQMYSLASNGTTGTFAGIAWSTSCDTQVYPMTPTDLGTPLINTGTVWTSDAQLITIRSLYAKYRPVSAGVKCTFTGSTVNDSGVLLVAQVSGAVPLSAFNALSMQQAAALTMNYAMYPVRNGSSIFWKPTEFDHISEWEKFFDLGASYGTGNYLTRPYLIVFAYGLAANGSGQISLECIVNYEGAYRSQTFMPGGLSAVPSVPPVDAWYEKLQRLTSHITAIAPVVGSAVSGYNRGGLLGAIGTLANGLYAPGRLGATGLPRLLN